MDPRVAKVSPPMLWFVTFPRNTSGAKGEKKVAAGATGTHVTLVTTLPKWSHALPERDTVQGTPSPTLNLDAHT